MSWYAGWAGRRRSVLMGAIRRYFRRQCLKYEASLRRAMADDAVHIAARDNIGCPICGAENEQECLYGAGYGVLSTGSGPRGERLPARCYPGKVHTRRLSRYLVSVGIERPFDIRPFVNPPPGPERRRLRPTYRKRRHPRVETARLRAVVALYRARIELRI